MSKQTDKESRKLFLDILMVLSALESYSFSIGKNMPDYLHENVASVVDRVYTELMDDGE